MYEWYHDYYYLYYIIIFVIIIINIINIIDYYMKKRVFGNLLSDIDDVHTFRSKEKRTQIKDHKMLPLNIKTDTIAIKIQ